VDKVYVCSTQFGFEALMCGKEVHVFGMPFYAGWGLTKDRQTCERRTNIRSLEEIFYIAYIMYSYYVNPEKKCRCEIEEAMDYLLNLREEYMKSKEDIVNG
jgi:capsular polysaccharide export protein